MRNILCFLCFFFLFQYSKAQIDSLKNTHSDTLKKRSRAHRYSNPDLARLYAQKLLERGLKNNNVNEIAYGYHQIGLVDQVLGNYKQALDPFNKSIEILKASPSKKNNLLLIDLYLVKGNSFFYLKDYKSALKGYEKALEMSEQLGNLKYQVISQMNIALIKKEIGLIKEALEIEKNNLLLAEDILFNNKTTPINLITNLADTYLILNDNDSAIYYNKIALGKSLLVDNIKGTSNIYNSLGLSYFNKKEYTRAITNFKEAEAIIIPFKNNFLLSEIYYNLSNCYYLQNDLKNAIYYIEKSKNVLTKEKAAEIQRLNIYKLAAEIYKEEGNLKKSSNYFEKYVALDNYRDQIKVDVIDDLHQNSLKTKNNTIASLTSKKKNQQQLYLKILIIGVLIFIIVLVFLFKYVHTSKRNKKAFQELLIKIKKEEKKKAKPQINDDKIKTILHQLQKLELKEHFLEDTFSLTTVAKKIRTNPSYLSRVINTHLNKSFQEYVNELRINYAIKRLREDRKFRLYSIRHIAKEIGYKSPNSFSRHFKKQTGIYPSFFISNINKTP